MPDAPVMRPGLFRMCLYNIISSPFPLGAPITMFTIVIRGIAGPRFSSGHGLTPSSVHCLHLQMLCFCYAIISSLYMVDDCRQDTLWMTEFYILSRTCIHTEDLINTTTFIFSRTSTIYVRFVKYPLVLTSGTFITTHSTCRMMLQMTTRLYENPYENLLGISDIWDVLVFSMTDGLP